MNKYQKNMLNDALKKVKSGFFYAGFFSLFVNLLMLVPSLYMLQVYDRVMASKSLDTLLFITLIVAVLFAVLGILQFIRSAILVRVGNKIDLELNKLIYDRVFEQAKINPGKVSSSPVTDLTKLRQYITGQGIFAFFDAPWFPIYLTVMYFFSPKLAYFTIFAGFVLVIITIINEMTTKKGLAEANTLHSQANMFLNKNIQNAEVIHAMGMKDDIKNKWLIKHLGFLSAQSDASSKAGKWANTSKTLRQFFQSLTYGIGAYLAINGEISGGTIIAGAVLMGRALAPLDLIVGSWKGFADAKSAYFRLQQLLKDTSQKVEKMDLPKPKGELHLERIVVVPPMSKQPSIKGVTMFIPKGSILGIIGPSGSGKSTLARAILGVWPLVQGKVRIDGADIHQWDSVKLGKYIGYLPQDIELLEGTIAENIARLGEVDSNKVIEAAKISGVHDLILKFPQGYDTPIGPGGIGLSGGQRQRVALARAIYKDPVLVVLDEPNSNLDDAGEEALRKTILNLREKGTTVIIISHKQNVLSTTNLLAFLQDGVLQLYGPTRDVLLKLQEANSKKRAPQAKPKQETKNMNVSLSKPGN